MAKKPISYRELVTEVSAELKKEAEAAGAKFDIKKVGKATSERWSKIKANQDPVYSAASSSSSGKSKKPKKAKKGKKAKSEHADEEHHSRKYVHHHVVTAQDILDNVDLSEDSREKIKAFIESSRANLCKSNKKNRKSRKKSKKPRKKGRKSRKVKSAPVEEEEEE